MSTLEALGRVYGTDKVDHGYLHHYEHYFGQLRFKPVHLLEIGVAGGRSLRMWDAFFTDPGSRIDGVEIDPAAAYNHQPRIGTYVADINDWRPRVDYDVVVDDGSHQAADILAAFDRLWPYVKRGGWYVIEDLATQWNPVFGGDRHGGPVAEQLVACLWSVTAPGEVHLHHQIAFLHKL